MAFQHLGDIDLEPGAFMTCHLHGFRALDIERHLELETTNGRTRNARRWFVRRYDPETFSRDFDKGKVVFRAWTFAEAMERINEPRLAKRIDKLAAE